MHFKVNSFNTLTAGTIIFHVRGNHSRIFLKKIGRYSNTKQMKASRNKQQFGLTLTNEKFVNS